MTLLWAAFLLGMVFGIAARWGRFCLLRGVRQALGRDNAQATGTAPALQAFALALAVALLATQALQWAGWVDLTQAQIVRPRFSVLGTLVGGALFGVGMVWANACGARSLVLLAGGNLRSLVTVVFLALGAQAAMTGVLAPVRQWLQSLWPTEAAHSTVMHSVLANGTAPSTAYALLAVLPALALFTYALWQPALRKSPVQWISALVIGSLVAVGWWMTATVDVDPFEPIKLTSLSFISPLAETLLYLQLAVGRDWSLGPALATGTVVGAFAAAMLSRTARWEGFETRLQLARSAGGGALMGFGGLTAAGCSIGQGLSGLSTLAWASFPAVAGIVLGAVLALSVQRRAA